MPTDTLLVAFRPSSQEAYETDWNRFTDLLYDRGIVLVDDLSPIDMVRSGDTYLEVYEAVVA